MDDARHDFPYIRTANEAQGLALRSEAGRGWIPLKDDSKEGGVCVAWRDQKGTPTLPRVQGFRRKSGVDFRSLTLRLDDHGGFVPLLGKVKYDGGQVTMVNTRLQSIVQYFTATMQCRSRRGHRRHVMPRVPFY